MFSRVSCGGEWLQLISMIIKYASFVAALVLACLRLYLPQDKPR